ncbi:L-threonylcarbamoyladenylate synthase [Granulicella sp. S156]|uniref:L-threonylcarbamoyladenylate synthase n=1 Tax=Granulicella sp. S156 TaxID=1747224 RepID=UPI00131CB1E1|nr:L-threonylcarbamoyladenylate synthase [Granulicella sp. S156]
MPTTLHLDAGKLEDISRAADLLRSGGTVAFATETVYGLGANALSETAVAKIFEAKQRPSWDPLIVHLASPAEIGSITSVEGELKRRVELLAASFWPGPLTLLLPRNMSVPSVVTAGRPLVGVRVPSHPAALALLRAVALPIAAPSANTFGHTSPTTAAHVLADLAGRIDAVLDAGPTTVGLESTVLDPAQTPMMLYRPGAVTAEQITAATGVAVEVFRPSEASTGLPQESLPSPGVGIRHYAPRARLVLVEGSEQALNQSLRDMLAKGTKQIGVLLPSDWHLDELVLVEPWAAWNDHVALAAALFAGLRALDDRGVNLILCPMPPSGGLNDAIRDRLEKAARPS